MTSPTEKPDTRDNEVNKAKIRIYKRKKKKYKAHTSFNLFSLV